MNKRTRANRFGDEFASTKHFVKLNYPRRGGGVIDMSTIENQEAEIATPLSKSNFRFCGPFETSLSNSETPKLPPEYNGEL